MLHSGIMPSEKMNYSVYEKWVTKSFRWMREARDEAIPHHIQMLGIVDAELRGVRNQDIFDSNGRPLENEGGYVDF